MRSFLLLLAMAKLPCSPGVVALLELPSTTQRLDDNGDLYLESYDLGLFIGFHSPTVSVVDSLLDEQLEWESIDASKATCWSHGRSFTRSSTVEDFVRTILSDDERASKVTDKFTWYASGSTLV